jgi:hypothetical protein
MKINTVKDTRTGNVPLVYTDMDTTDPQITIKQLLLSDGNGVQMAKNINMKLSKPKS